MILYDLWWLFREAISMIRWVMFENNNKIKLNYGFCLENCEIALSKSSFQRLLHPYAITVDANYIYWTDWREKSIYRVPKRNTSAPPEVMRKQLENIRDVHVYDASRQTGMTIYVIDIYRRALKFIPPLKTSTFSKNYHRPRI